MRTRFHLGFNIGNTGNQSFCRDKSIARFAYVLSVALIFAIPAAAGPPDPGHQIDFTAGGLVQRPATREEAVKTLDARRREIGSYLACGNELELMRKVRAGGRSISDDERIMLSLAKVQWLVWAPPTDDRSKLVSSDNDGGLTHIRAAFLGSRCTRYVLVPPPILDHNNKDFDQQAVDDWNLLDSMRQRQSAEMGISLRGLDLNQTMAETFGQSCDYIIFNVQTDTDTGQLGVSFDLTPDCLVSQINQALSEVIATGNMGTGNGMPCHITSTLSDDDGNWDFSMAVLMRILYTDPGMILGPAQRQHITRDLIQTGPDLGPGGYPVTGCGNTEHVTGDASDRVEDDNVLDDIGDALGDVFDWLRHHFFVTNPLAAGLIALNPLVAIVLEATGNLSFQLTIPETENHRLLIESTRYLNNQILHDEFVQDGDNDRLKTLEEAQSKVKDWLLGRMQDIVGSDFIEYNSRPYQRESIRALLNLFDFARDPNVKTGARLVLEAAFAKYAVGSHEARRLVPFRRHMEAIVNPLEADKDTHVPANVLEPGNQADYQVPQGLLYTGQTQQVPDGRWVSNLVGGEVGFSAFSGFVPDVLMLDLAIDKSLPYLQRFRHGGFEAYASGRGYLITAGGLRTDYSSTVLGLGDANDMGAAVPTTLMLSGPGAAETDGTGRATIWSFLRFQGLREQVTGSSPFGGHTPQITFDHNACVDRGFACGINLAIPPDIARCLHEGPPGTEPGWSFLDSKACPGYEDGPAVYVAIAKRSCGAAVETCVDFGVIEAVDVDTPSQAAFDAFIAGVLSHNPPGSIPDGPPVLVGGGGGQLVASLPRRYTTSDGRQIAFDVTAHIRDSDRTGLDALGKWPDLPAAAGEIIDANGHGTRLISKDDLVMTINNPRMPDRSIVLDFSDRNAPRRDPP
jgi:hypothetical protein